MRFWLNALELYLVQTPDDQYLQFAASYLGGKPKNYWNNQFAVWQAANPNQQPANVRQFFRDTMIRGYGLRDPIQSYWDTWNKLHQGPGQSVDEYNVQFEQALTDLSGRFNDEEVKIERYRSGLQTDIREMCRSNPFGQRWPNLRDLMTYATLQWPTVEERLAKLKSSQPAGKVGGKRKASGGSPGRSSKAKLSVALTDEQREHNMKHRLCHKCGKPGHIARDCEGEETPGKASKSKGKNKKKSSEDF